MNTIPQRLYDSEINFEVLTFWDGGFDVRLGDQMNGFTAGTSVRTYDEALAWLDVEARKAYPNSLYTTGELPEGYKVGPCGALLPGATGADGESIGL